MRGSGRHRLSFGEQGPSHRHAIRRRVFAQLAPHEAGEQLERDHDRDFSDTDNERPLALVQIHQVAHPPTPPRRRSWRAVDSSDSDNETRHNALALATQQSAPLPANPYADNDEEHVRLALEQFGQTRRQRFMREQRTRYLDAAALSNLSTGGHESLTRQLFPSNDVDSYWYNQASPASEVSPVSVSVPVPVPVHRVNRLQMRRYQPLPLPPPPPPPPPVSRSHLSDESRRAMLEVLRASNGFTALETELGGSNDDEEEGESYERHQHQYQQLHQLLRRHRPVLERALDKNSAVNGSGGRDGGMRSGLCRQPTASWLARHTVAARALDCSLLQPGMKFVGVQKIKHQGRHRDSRSAGLNFELGVEQWDVEVAVQTVDMRRGRLTGIMNAMNVPNMPTTVVTCWDGEVVDFKNFLPLTGKWRASADNDAQHWRLFEPLLASSSGSSADAFLCQWPDALRGKRMPRLLEDYIFMRWKEKSFVNLSPQDVELTIEGFYYISMNRRSGAIEAMRVDSLLNPAPTHAERLAVAALGKADEQPPHTACAAFAHSGRRVPFIGNEKDDFEMAVWRQESGLGPPLPSPSPSSAPVSSEFDYFAQVSEPLASADLSKGGHGARASVQGHAEYMRRQTHSGDTQHPPSSLFYTSALSYARGEKPQNTAAVTDDIRPQIFVAWPPIVAQGAMSTDKSGDYIRPPSGSEHLLGQAVLERPSPPPRSLPGFACSENVSSASSSPPALSSSASTAFSDAGSSTSAKSQTSGKRLRLRLHSDAVAAAAVLTSLSGRTVADSFDEEDEDDDDESDPYAAVLAAANSVAAREAKPAMTAASCLSAPCCLSSPGPDVTNHSVGYSPPPPLPSLCLANSCPSIAIANMDDDKCRGAASFHKRKSSRASSSGAANLDVDVSSSTAALKEPAVKRHRTQSSLSSSKSAKDEVNSSTSDCTPAADEPVVNWKSLEVPEEIWVKAQELYDQVKTLKKVQNRQPVRKRPAILAALMFILCRSHGFPRTFAEICTAANVSKREIGMYYNLMKSVLDSEYTTNQRAKPSEFLQRWCTVLELPAWMAGAATCIYDRADNLAIVQGKCPISVSAACIWLVVWAFNHRHALDKAGFALPEDTPVTSAATPNLPCFAKSDTFVSCDQRDVCKTASVVIATLTSVFKLLLPHLSVLIDGLLSEHL
ncbi:hypothetical protein GGI20_000481 [Coemansia sp. BCRC 34301]|nr:hypothetical protein GGI20_000481 [Coemansia sp. BCRC 34301]